jgi:YidC/Oxa1 family membrane protein insertase
MNSIANLLSPLSKFFFAILKFLHGGHPVPGSPNLWVGGVMSWAWAIVLLTVIVRIVLIPLTWRQIKSMRAMQALQPRIKELQDKYKGDRPLLQQKTMEFYQENKVSPFGSCLPLILQLPVFFGLYYMLRGQSGVSQAGVQGVLIGQPWLWIHDITKFDLLLMFLYIASQFVASWQTARNAGGQQKMIAYFMPVMVGIFMFVGKWPAGLFIYWFTSNLWTIVQQFVAERIMPTPIPIQASAVSTRGGPAKPPAKTPARVTPGKPGARPAVKSGGKPSGQKAGTTGKQTGGQSQRPNRGAGRPKGTRGT